MSRAEKIDETRYQLAVVEAKPIPPAACGMDECDEGVGMTPERTWQFRRAGCRVYNALGHKIADIHVGHIEEQELKWRGETIADAPRLKALVADLGRALCELHDNTVEYIRINNLSGAENNHDLKQARAAIAKLKIGDLDD